MTEQERDYEKEATREGWVAPKEGDGEDRVDAKTFVERGEKISGILKAKVDRQQEQINSLLTSNKEFKTYHDKSIAKERDKTAKAISDLEVERAKAVDDGDGAAFTKADREIQDLRAQEAPGNDGAQQHQVLVNQWQANNSWYADNRKLQIYADGLCEGIIAEGYQGQAYFNELTRRVKQDFPEEFENPNRTRANGVEIGGEQETNAKPKSFEALDAEAKAAFERFNKDGITITKEDYVANYDWD